MEALCAHLRMRLLHSGLSNALVSYVKYLLLTFWPNDLAVYYPLPPTGIPAWQVIGAAFLLIGITALCFFQRRIRPYLIVGWLWFLGTLVPVIGIVQVGGQTMADRYFYIPSIGLFIAIVFGLADLAKSWRVAPSLSAGIAGGVLLILATLTNAQIQRWRDSFTLFEHTLAVTPPNLHIEHNLGLALGVAADTMRPRRILRRHCRSTPISMTAWWAWALLVGSRADCRKPLIISKPQSIHSRTRRQRTCSWAAHYGSRTAIKPPLRRSRRASQLAPKDPDIRADFGLALRMVGRIPEAIEQFHEALRMNPNNAEAHANLGLALLASGKPRESIPEFEMALRLKPELKGAADNLRRAQAQSGSQR